MNGHVGIYGRRLKVKKLMGNIVDRNEGRGG
jgi:hypothetical protein